MAVPYFDSRYFDPQQYEELKRIERGYGSGATRNQYQTVHLYNPADETNRWFSPELASQLVHKMGFIEGFRPNSSNGSNSGSGTGGANLNPGVQTGSGIINEGARIQQVTDENLLPVQAATNVELGAEQRQLIDLLSGYLGNENSGLRKLLSGTPDWGQFQSGVAEPLMSAQQEQVAGINNQFSGTGSSFFSGARERSVDESNNKLQQALAQLRYQESQNAKTNMLSAIDRLPAINEILNDVTANDTANMERALETFYKNQGLTAEQARADLAALQEMNDQQNAQQDFALRQDTLNSQNQNNVNAMALQRYLGELQAEVDLYGIDSGTANTRRQILAQQIGPTTNVPFSITASNSGASGDFQEWLRQTLGEFGYQ